MSPGADRDMRELTRALKENTEELKALKKHLERIYRISSEVQAFQKYLGIPAEEALSNAKAGSEQIQRIAEPRSVANPLLCVTCHENNCVRGSRQKYVLPTQCDCCDSDHNL